LQHYLGSCCFFTQSLNSQPIPVPFLPVEDDLKPCGLIERCASGSRTNITISRGHAGDTVEGDAARPKPSGCDNLLDNAIEHIPNGGSVRLGQRSMNGSSCSTAVLRTLVPGPWSMWDRNHGKFCEDVLPPARLVVPGKLPHRRQVRV
jgi:hypothetical protein